jgi:hypothetical protein
VVELNNTTPAAGGRDNFGAGNKFITPLIVNGKVYVGTTTGVGVFGLLSDGPDGGHRSTVCQISCLEQGCWSAAQFKVARWR